MDNLEEQLSRPRIEDEDGPVDGLCRQVTLERLKDSCIIIGNGSRLPEMMKCSQTLYFRLIQYFGGV